VLGHSHCGAIKGVCDDVKLGNLTAMLGKLKPAVEAVNDISGARNSTNPDFVQAVADKNIDITIANIRERSEVLRQMEELGEIDIVGGMYDIHTGEVIFHLDSDMQQKQYTHMEMSA
jgi:carbonic anhydrase